MFISIQSSVLWIMDSQWARVLPAPGPPGTSGWLFIQSVMSKTCRVGSNCEVNRDLCACPRRWTDPKIPEMPSSGVASARVRKSNCATRRIKEQERSQDS